MKIIIRNKRIMLADRLNVPWEAYHYMGLEWLYLIPYFRLKKLFNKILGIHWLGGDHKKRYFNWYKRWRDPKYGMVYRYLPKRTFKD